MSDRPQSGGKTASPVPRRSLTPHEGAPHTLADAHPVPAGPQAAVAAREEWKPAFFDAHQNETLIALAEGIFPGSTAAQANRFLDLALGTDTQENQQRFVAALKVMDGEAVRRFAKPYKDLSKSQQIQILTVASAGPSSRPNGSAGSVERGGFHARTPAPNLRDCFDHLKVWISLAYYSSEVGKKELGWTGENFFRSFPACEPPGGHA